MKARVHKAHFNNTCLYVLAQVDAQTLKYTCLNLVENNEYFIRVRAVNAEGESEPLESKDGVVPKKIIGKSCLKIEL